MLEAKIRQLHRVGGIYLVAFLALQVVSGLLIAWGTLMDSPRDTFWFAAMDSIHHNWNPVGSVYRIILGVLTTGQALGGVFIYLLMRARLNKP